MESNKKIRLNYYEDNVSRLHHVIAYILSVIVITVIFYIYYHAIVISLIGGIVLGFFQTRSYIKYSIKKRQNKLRLQFKEFLDIIAISISGGAGQSMENAIRGSLRELKMLYSADSDIVNEIEIIVSDFDYSGIPMKEGFKELGERSEVDDIMSFATVYDSIDGKTSDYGFIISQTRNIIKDKIEITMEIETTITAAKTETYMMLVLPLVIVMALSVMGSGFMDGLFTTASGRIAATIGLICTFASYVLATKATDIKV